MLKNIRRLYAIIFSILIFIFIGNDYCLSDDNITRSENYIIATQNIKMSVYVKGTLLHENSTKHYSIKNIFDQNKINVWATRFIKKESPKNDIYITFAYAQQIDSISIYNGFIKNETLFKDNARIKTIHFVFYNDIDYVKPFAEKDITLQDTSKVQEINFQNIIMNNIKRIEISIKDIYPGLKFDDICLSDLNINFAKKNTDNSQIADNYLIDDNLVEEVVHWDGYNIFFNGMSFFKNINVNEIILIKSYEITKAEIHHFYINNIPEDLIEHHNNFVKNNKKEINVLDTFKTAIQNAKIIDKEYFISEKGFTLGIDKNKVISLYGKPDTISKIGNIEILTWTLYGTTTLSPKIINQNDKIMKNIMFNRHIIVYFLKEKANYCQFSRS